MAVNSGPRDFVGQMIDGGFQALERQQPRVRELMRRVADPNNPTAEEDAAALARLRVHRKLTLEIVAALHEAESKNIDRIWRQ